MRALITGAADGIGRALANVCGHVGYEVVGVDIDEMRSRQCVAELQAAGCSADIVQADLSNWEELPGLLAELTRRGPYDLVIHNAGINAVGPFAELDPAQQRAVVAVNFTAPLLLTAGLLAENQIAQNGTFVFISSLSHFVSYPGAAVYAATKDGIDAYARSLRTALAPNVNVLTVFPGPTRTAHARRYSPDNRREHKRMPPEELARQILQAVQRRQWTLIPGVGNRLFALVGRIFPALVERVMRKTLYEKLSPTSLPPSS